MGKHLVGKALIAKLNKLTELEVSDFTSTAVDETALAIVKRMESKEITIVSVQRKIIFDHSILSALIHLTNKTLQTGS